MWRWAVAAVLLVSSAVAASTARPAPRSATAFSRCSEVVVGGQPTQLPDGTILYGYGHALHSVRSDGTHNRALRNADAPLSFPAVSPDGRLIAFDKGSTSHEIWLMNSDGSGAHYVAPGTSPAFAPDGTHLAIGGAPTGSYRAALDVIGIDGAGRRTLAVDALPSPEPAWSPDGTKIVFDSYETGIYASGPVLKAVNADGTDERTLSGGEAASWSPDGDAVVYSQPRYETGQELDVINADGTGWHALKPSDGRFDAISPTWSVKGRNVTFVMTPADYPHANDGVMWQLDATGRGRHLLAADCRFGTGASDRLRGTPRRDSIYALEGNDTIDVRRGGRDFVDCGPGRDVVRADPRDVVARSCERRRR